MKLWINQTCDSELRSSGILQFRRLNSYLFHPPACKFLEGEIIEGYSFLRNIYIHIAGVPL